MISVLFEIPIVATQTISDWEFGVLFRFEVLWFISFRFSRQFGSFLYFWKYSGIARMF